jgi:3-phosphoshikimate 1-carboxyvinyltransferase
MSDQRIPILKSPFRATITPPGSKSLTNRALVLSALAGGECVISNLLFADDTVVMLDCLGKLGFELEVDHQARTVRIVGQGGLLPRATADLFCGNSGTTIRFLAAMCAVGHGRYTLDGIARMRQRPIGQLVELLGHLGVRSEFLDNAGFPPIAIVADGLPGGLLKFVSGASSQFLSAVLQAAPYARNEVRIDLEGAQSSWPYVAMTMRLMDEFGHTPHLIRDAAGNPRQIIVPQGAYSATRYTVEPDASNASYFLAVAAIHPGASVTIEGLGKQSLQGDVGFADLLHQMGADLLFGKDFITVRGTGDFRGIEANLVHMPDMAQTLAVAAIFAKGETHLTGLHSLRVKETDRITALATELRKLGAGVEVEGDDLTITPSDRLEPAAIDTYDDHRMAMSFAVAATKVDGIVIKDAECVNKTYPAFFDDMARLRGES